MPRVSRRAVGAWLGTGWWGGFSVPAASTGVASSATVELPAVVTPVSVRRSPHVGINLSGLSYWSSQFALADLAKSNGGWTSLINRDRTGELELRPDGYPARLGPGQRAIATVAQAGSGFPDGLYVVRWDGEGDVGFAINRIDVRSRSPGRVVFAAPTRGSIYISIERTDPHDPVRNLRVFLPGTEEAAARQQPFNPLYLERLAPFSTLRFMDWGRTNGSAVVEWADRAQLGDASYTRNGGVSIERMIDLANALQADPWFCIPHQASDDYVRRFAALLLERLDGRLRPHLEYSNEVWNWGFAQSRWAAAQSDRLGLPRSFGTPSAFYAQRSVEMFRIAREVWGSAASRIVRVVAGQAAWGQFLENALAWRDTAAQADALAIAPYFRAEAAGDAKLAEANLQLPPEAIVEQWFESVRFKVKPRMEAAAALARRHRLVMKGYEGGAHDTTSRFPKDAQDRMAAVFATAHRHPAMREVYGEYYRHWTAAGGDVLCQFNDIGRWSKWGLWSALESVTQDPASSPKYLGLLDAIAANPTAAAAPRLGR